MNHEPEIDEGLDPDGPSAADLDEFGGEFIRCPHCGQEHYDQAELCPHCGMAREDEPEGGVPIWAIITTVVVLMAIVLFWVF
ncbi:MAG: zinc ribbon domain-containing protein [Planctomycetota bacterium]|nr:zinc ribbon domain-containing protein [Planctomycetota bacterium]